MKRGGLHAAEQRGGAGDMGRYKEIQGDVGRYSAAACMLDSSAVARRGCAVGTHAEMAAV